MNAAEVARDLGVTEPQARQWLDLLAKDGTLEKSSRPVRYSVRQANLFERTDTAGSGSNSGTPGSTQ
jgi:predicted ArsR family transcriptional regulator